MSVLQVPFGHLPGWGIKPVVMRKLLLLFVGSVIAFSAVSQTDYQRYLLKDYFENTGFYLLQKYAQPVNEAIGKEVSVYDNTVYIKIYYKAKIFSDYYDTYRIEVDNIGKFTEMEVIHDGAALVPAFDVCNIARESFSDWLNEDYEGTPSEKRNILSYSEAALGKSLSQFSCKDICFYQLFYRWRKNGYYSKY